MYIYVCSLKRRFCSVDCRRHLYDKLVVLKSFVIMLMNLVQGNESRKKSVKKRIVRKLKTLVFLLIIKNLLLSLNFFN